MTILTPPVPLKACPFCASDGELLQLTVDRNGSDIHPFPWLAVVTCSFCQCKRFALGKTPEAAAEKAVEDWQVRKVPPALRYEVRVKESSEPLVATFRYPDQAGTWAKEQYPNRWILTDTKPA